jgi:hypothetical protein
MVFGSLFRRLILRDLAEIRESGISGWPDADSVFHRNRAQVYGLADFR